MSDNRPAAERILGYLSENFPHCYTNRHMALVLNLPVDSVRRVVNSLRRSNDVVMVSDPEQRHREWMIA